MLPLDLTKSHLLLQDLQSLRIGLAALNKMDPVLRRVLVGLDRALTNPQQTSDIELRFVLDTAQYITKSYGDDALPLVRLLQKIDDELEHQELSQRLARHEKWAEVNLAADRFLKLVARN
jgi:hypothetical protein